jgi:hypothetical protein
MFPPLKHFETRSFPHPAVGAELGGTIAFESACSLRGAPERPVAEGRTNPFLLRSLPRKLVEIPGRFSSSLPPPSFVRGRSAAFFMTADAAPRGIGLFACTPCAA